jgi:hypothetical protein
MVTSVSFYKKIIVMETTGRKLKKLRTKQVYGFKKSPFSGGGGNPIGDPTTITTITVTNIALNTEP